MISHKKGFTLIEVVIGMMISTILLSAAFTIYNQITKSIDITQQVTTDDTKTVVLYDRLQQDLLGIAPLWFTKKLYADTKPITEQNQQPQQSNDLEVQTNNFFHAENKNNRFYYFTFVTTNAMQIYGTDNKRFVRVIYLLKPENNEENSFKLLRKELDQVTSEFDTKTVEKKENFYTIATTIKECSFEYGFINQPKKQKEAKQAKAESDNKPAQLTWHNEWGIVREKTKTNEYKPALPQYVKLTLSFTTKAKHELKKHEIYFMVPIDAQIKIQSFAKKRHKEAKQAKGLIAPNAQEIAKNEPKANEPKAKAG